MWSYLPHLAAREDLQAFFIWRLGSEAQARASTDVTCMLRMLLSASGFANLRQLEECLNRTGAGARFNDGYLKQYVNWGKGRKPTRGSPKRMRVSFADRSGVEAGALALIEAAWQANIIDTARAGGLLIALDREEMLGKLAQAWRSKKRAYPTTLKSWQDVWKAAEIEAMAVWNRRSSWHKDAVRSIIAARVENRAMEFAAECQTDRDRLLVSGNTVVGSGYVEEVVSTASEYRIGMVLTGGTATMRAMLIVEDLYGDRPRSPR